MATLDTYYWNNPISVIDQNQWTTYHPEVALMFRNRAVYTPLIDWTNEPQNTGGLTNVQTELLEPDVNADEIPLTATSIDALGVDSRSRSYTVKRYAGAVQLNEMSNVFQQWQLGGGRDWRPVLRGVLGNDVINKHEMLARNIFLQSPTARWTYGGSATSIGTIGSGDKFSLDRVIDWNFRLGNTGSPVVPGDAASAKVAIIPPGVTYDLRKSLASAATNEAQMWRDARIYNGETLNYEIGEFSGVRFVENPSNKFGINNAVLYNTGAITKQWGVINRISAGDGAPDPETTTVDGVWQVGQKNVSHSITLENFAGGDYNVNDIVTIHTKRTSAYGVTNGVDPLDGTAIQRRVVAVDASANTLTFDRPIMTNYHVPITTSAGSVTGAAAGTFYAFVTRGRSIGMVLIMGSRGGVLGATARPLRFYEPKPIDQFESIWRFSYDMVLGHNVWEPNYFELYFCAVSLPKPGGVIAP